MANCFGSVQLLDSTNPYNQCQANKMKSLSRMAYKGGVALSIVGLGVACHQIASTDNKQEKNEILVESLGGVAGGVMYSMATTAMVLFMATPVGWSAALLIGVGSVVTGYTGSVIAKNVYDLYGNKYDLTSEIGVSKLCK